MKAHNLKIGVFDSGLGGLTIVQSIISTIQGCDIYYIADTLHAPYGEKSTKQILGYSLQITKFLLDSYDIDALVVACNTATSAAIETIRQTYPNLIVVGTEPAIKPAIEVSDTKSIGVLATKATLQGKKYKELVSKLTSQNNTKVYEVACVGLVEQIEAGEIDSPKTKQMLTSWLEPMIEKGVDTIVLGCTHYPLVASQISQIMANNPKLMHSATAIANRLKSLLPQTNKTKPNYLHIIATSKIDESIIQEIIDASYDFECRVLEPKYMVRG
jgi:glutamate racemase